MGNHNLCTWYPWYLSERGYLVPGTRFLRTPSLLMSSDFHLDSRFLAVIDHSVVRQGIPNKAGIPWRPPDEITMNE